MIKMLLNIRGDKIKITSPMKDYIEAKLVKLDKYFGDADEIEVTALVRVRNENQIIEVTVPTAKFTLRAEEAHKDLYAATDLVVDKLERQIRKNKTRAKKQIHRDHQPFIDDFEIEKEEKEESKVVRKKMVEMKPMSEEEAILQLELLGHDFFVFEDMEDNNINVLYKRKDGNYGIMEIR